ncbi:MAG: hypothetical protein J6P47_01920 [Acetobacter sp.]|nr:hypothetical protein [Acetobacter sp.]
MTYLFPSPVMALAYRAFGVAQSTSSCRDKALWSVSSMKEAYQYWRVELSLNICLLFIFI